MMTSERLQDLSIYYWLKEMFSSTSFIKVVDGFPMEDFVIPCISVEAKSLRKRQLELGTRKTLLPRIWYIDIFGKTKSQRDEIGYKIFNELDYPIPVHNYNLGEPPIELPKLGVLKPDDCNMEIVRINPNLVEELYYRATISFVAEYENV
jgi:hypothetical protein